MIPGEVTPKPIYKHDCQSGCVFHGTFADKYDVYTHRRNHGLHDLILRFGNEGSEYYSNSFKDSDLRAIRIGNVSEDEKIIILMAQKCISPILSCSRPVHREVTKTMSPVKDYFDEET